MTRELQGLFAAGADAGRIFESEAAVLWLALPPGALGPDEENEPALDEVLDIVQRAAWCELTRRWGLDYTLVVQPPRARDLLIVRGPFSRTPVYVSAAAGARPFATRLGQGTDAGANPEFLPALLANACLPCPVECDHTLATAVRGWQRAPRASVTEYRDGRASVRATFGLPRYADLAGRAREALEDSLRSALDERIVRLARGEPVAAELSGGIDSGVVAARARRLLGERFLGGVSLVTPYPELRREVEFIEASAAHAGVQAYRVDVDARLPFARLAETPLHDEPSLSSLPWALMAGSLDAARAMGARLHLHGIGGDQVFAPAPARFAALESSVPLSFLAWTARPAFRRARREVRHRLCAGQPPRFVEEGTLLYDGWADRYVAPTCGLRFEGVYLDPRIIRLCEALHAREPAGGPPKSIARRAFAAELAPAVRARRGKVGFDGVYQRGLRRHFADVRGLVDSQARALERAKVKPARLLESLDRCARRGWGSDATPLFATLAWAIWRHARERHGLSA